MSAWIVYRRYVVDVPDDHAAPDLHALASVPDRILTNARCTEVQICHESNDPDPRWHRLPEIARD